MSQSYILLFKQAGLDVLQHGVQLLLHLGLGNGHLCTRVSPYCHTLTLLQVFGTHFETNRNPLHENQTLLCLFILLSVPWKAA